MKKKITEESKAGFTIVELTLTMSFVAVLLITIAIIVTNVLAIYQKGMTIKAVNNVGRGLVDSLTESIMDAPALNTATACAKLPDGARSKCIDDNATMAFSYNTYEENEQQLYGVFCTGSYSYIWNTNYAFQKSNGSTGNSVLSLVYNEIDNAGNLIEKTIGDTSDPSSSDALRLAKVHDPTRRVCTASIDKETYESKLTPAAFSSSTEINITEYLDSDTKLYVETPETNLLANNDAQLLLYELTIFPRNENTTSGRVFYSGTFILGTERGDINIKSASEYCQNSETSSTGNLGAEFNYCALNKFNFAARTAGE